jgi:hypothetical protein
MELQKQIVENDEIIVSRVSSESGWRPTLFISFLSINEILTSFCSFIAKIDHMGVGNGEQFSSVFCIGKLLFALVAKISFICYRYLVV